MELKTDQCHWCLDRIVWAPIARQWWHRRPGALHCFPDLFLEDGTLRYHHKASTRKDGVLR